MRTTLTIDDAVARAIKNLARLRGVPFKAVIDGLLRRGLAAEAGQGAEGERPFVVKANRSGLANAIDPQRLNQLLDELESERFLLDASERAPRKGSR